MSIDTKPGYTEHEGINRSPRDFVQIIFKHKGKILLFFLIITLPLMLWVIMQPSLYQSKAKILVKEGRENTIPTPEMTEGPILVDITRPEDINSEIEILKSRLLAEKVVEALGTDLKKSPSKTTQGLSSSSSTIQQSFLRIGGECKNLFKQICPPLLSSPEQNGRLSFEAKVLYVQKRLIVEKVPESNVIAVSFDDADPGIPADVIDSLLTFYLDHHLAVYKTPEAYQFFAEQETHFHQKLEEAEQSLEEMKKQWSLAELQLQKEILVRQIGEYENELNSAQMEKVSLREQLNQHQQQLKTQQEKIWLSETSKINPLLTQLSAQVSQLQLEEKKLMEKFVDQNHKKIQDIRSEIKEIEGQLTKLQSPIQTDVVIGVNALHQSLMKSVLENQAGLEAAEAREKNLRNHLASIKEELAVLNDRELELNRLTRQINIYEENYQLYRRKVEDKKISQAMDLARMANISIIQPASLPLEPLPRRTTFKMLMAILLGITAGLGITLIAEFMDRTVRTAQEVESSLGVPVLGTIPNLKEK